MTLLHSAAFMTDCLLLFIYWHRITRPELSVEEYDNFKNILRFHRDKGLLHPAVKTLHGIKGFFISLFTGRFFVQLIKFPIYIWRAVKTCFYPTEIGIYLRQALSGLTAFSLWIFIIVSLLNFSVLIVIKSIHEDSRVFTFFFLNRNLIPHLELSEKTLIASPPSDEIISQYMAMGKTEYDAWIDKAKGLNLRKRDLRFASFYKSNLMKADLSTAQLHGANLPGAQLQEADLTAAQLQGAHLWVAQLQGAHLGSAQLRGANLEFAQLQGADLWAVQLRGADLEETELQGAYLEGANFNCTLLQETNLQGVLFDNIGVQTDINWDELSESIRPWIPKTFLRLGADRNFLIAQMKKAKEQCAKFKKEDFPVIKSDFDTFMKIRKELTCKDIYISEGMSRKEIGYKGTDVGKALYAHMKSSCPDTLQKIKDRGKVNLSKFEK